MHPDHDKIKKLLEGQRIETVRTGYGALELTLSSTHPAVTLTIEGTDFQIRAFEDPKSVESTGSHRFSHFRDFESASSDKAFLEEVLAVFKRHGKVLDDDYQIGWFIERLGTDTIEEIRRDLKRKDAR